LRVADFSAARADRLVDVAVGHHEIEPAIEVHVGEDTAEAETAARSAADAGRNRDVLVEAERLRPVEADHFLIEVGDRDAGAPGIVEVTSIDPHAGPRAPLRAEG